jgi:1,4-dihydroxy-2-naphthoate octaprenyltransferase
MGVGACAVLVANNLRDIPTDRASGKMTLSVRLGDKGSRWFFTLLCLLTVLGLVWFAACTTWWALLGLLIVVPMIPSVKIVLSGATGLNLILVLKLIGIAALVGAIGCFIGVWIAQL